jgi:hypothetical protein
VIFSSCGREGERAAPGAAEARHSPHAARPAATAGLGLPGGPVRARSRPQKAGAHLHHRAWRPHRRQLPLRRARGAGGRQLQRRERRGSRQQRVSPAGRLLRGGAGWGTGAGGGGVGRGAAGGAPSPARCRREVAARGRGWAAAAPGRRPRSHRGARTWAWPCAGGRSCCCCGCCAALCGAPRGSAAAMARPPLRAQGAREGASEGNVLGCAPRAPSRGARGGDLSHSPGAPRTCWPQARCRRGSRTARRGRSAEPAFLRGASRRGAAGRGAAQRWI